MSRVPPEETKHGRCEATNRNGEQCGRAAVDNRGKCGYHGGKTPIEHGIYSDVVREEDRELLDALEDLNTKQKLEETLNIQIMKLRRAIDGMESEDKAAFMDVFEEVVAGAAAPDGTIEGNQLRSLAKMLGQNDRAIREWMDLIRKTAKDLHKIEDDSPDRVEHSVDTDRMDEFAAAIGLNAEDTDE